MPVNSSKFNSKIKKQQLVDDTRTHEMLHTLQQHVQSRNTFTASEFKTFEPLYQKDTPPEVRKELEKKMAEKTSPFNPIRVVADQGNKEGVHEVLFEFPPRLSPINPINSRKVKTTELVDTFVNSTKDQNPLNVRAEVSTDRLLQVMSQTVRNEEGRAIASKQAIVAEKLIQDAKLASHLPVEHLPAEEADPSIDDFDFDSVPSEREEDSELDEDDLDFENDETSLDDMEGDD